MVDLLNLNNGFSLFYFDLKCRISVYLVKKVQWFRLKRMATDKLAYGYAAIQIFYVHVFCVQGNLKRIFLLKEQNRFFYDHQNLSLVNYM